MQGRCSGRSAGHRLLRAGRSVALAGSRPACQRGTVEAVTRSGAQGGATRPGSIVQADGSFPLCIPSPVQELEDKRVADAGVRLLLKRDDLINPDVPGNKWRKLKYNLAEARNLPGKARFVFILSFLGEKRVNASDPGARKL